MISSTPFYVLGIALIFAGIIISAIAIVLLFILGTEKGKVRGGGAIIIGPVPIIFGTDPKSFKTVLLLSLAVAVMLAVAMILYYLLLR